MCSDGPGSLAVVLLRLAPWSEPIGNPAAKRSSIGDPRSSVRLLQTEDELRGALERALGYDHDAEGVLQWRIDTYAASGKQPSARGDRSSVPRTRHRSNAHRKDGNGMSTGTLFAPEVASLQSGTELFGAASIHSTESVSEINRKLQLETPRSPLSLRWYGGPPPRQPVAPVVVTGAFDILHPGHVRFLTWAATRGRPLYVGVEDDERVRHRKGPRRPLHTVAERAEVLSALKPVSMVFYILGDPTVCEGDDYVSLLRQIGPAALAFTAGDPHAEAKRVGAAAMGADFLEFPFEVGHSTSSLFDSAVRECPQHLNPVGGS